MMQQPSSLRAVSKKCQTKRNKGKKKTKEHYCEPTRIWSLPFSFFGSVCACVRACVRASMYRMRMCVCCVCMYADDGVQL